MIFVESLQNHKSSKILIPWVVNTTLAMMLANVVGPTAGETVGFFLGDIAEAIILQIWNVWSPGYIASMVAGSVNGLVAGMVIGILQWLVLRQWIKNAGWWILLTMFGFAIGSFLASGFINSIINYLGDPASAWPIGLILASPISALSITLFQWILFIKSSERPFWWIPASLLGWIVGHSAFAVGMSAAMSLGMMNMLVEAILAAGSGFLTGAITGLALVYILDQPSIETTS